MMNPRLKSSKKWTNFPKDYSDQIQAVFKENFGSYFDETTAELLVEGRIYSEEIMLRIEFCEKGRLAHANFEVSINYSQETEEAIARIHSCVDAAASMMMEYFEQEGDVDFPYSWKDFTFQGKKVYLKFSSTNANLEAEANRLLGLHPEGLLNEEDETADDALAYAEHSEELSPPRDDDDEIEESDIDDEEDDSDSNEPRMFGGIKKRRLQ